VFGWWGLVFGIGKTWLGVGEAVWDCGGDSFGAAVAQSAAEEKAFQQKRF
jgi:hypothetical protein